MVHSIAAELGLEVFVVSLSRPDMNDSNLNKLVSDLVDPCVVLFEDLDAVLSHSLKGDMGKDAQDTTLEHHSISSPLSRVTLNSLLNVLDSAQGGRMYYATTDHFSRLDKDLCRPGRMDVHVEFKLASKYQAKELFKSFYLSSSREEDVSTCPSPSQTYSASDPSSPPIYPLNHSTQHIDAVRRDLTHSKTVLELADRFADIIPEREFSMSKLQEYLSSYTARPFDAVDSAAAWVHRGCAKKARKMHDMQVRVS